MIHFRFIFRLTRHCYLVVTERRRPAKVRFGSPRYRSEWASPQARTAFYLALFCTLMAVTSLLRVLLHG